MIKHLQAANFLALWAAVVFLFGRSISVEAHNGEMALAVPVAGIVIDGDLSDWPEDVVKYPILYPESGDEPQGTKDFQGSLQAGYDAQENVLYLALEVLDDSIIREPAEKVKWDSQDGCDLFVEAGHGENAAAHFLLQGNTRRAIGRNASLEDFEVEVERGDFKHSYEWRLDIGKMSDGQLDLHPGLILSVDVAVIDKDDDGSLSYIAWGKGVSQARTADSRGDVALVESYADVGAITGSVTTEKLKEPFSGFELAAFRDDEPAGRVLTDAEGMYRLVLLPGAYTLKPGPGQGVEPFELSGLVVRAGEEATKDLIASAPGAIAGRVTTGEKEPRF